MPWYNEEGESPVATLPGCQRILLALFVPSLPQRPTPFIQTLGLLHSLASDLASAPSISWPATCHYIMGGFGCQTDLVERPSMILRDEADIGG